MPIMDNERLHRAGQAYRDANAALDAQYGERSSDRAAWEAWDAGKQAAAAAFLAEKNAVYAPVDAMLDRIDDDDSPVS